MNLYLVLALALGVSAPSAPPHLTSVVAESKLSSQRAVAQFAVRSSRFAVGRSYCQLPTGNCELVEAPLTGAATPRAPASSR